MSSPLRVFGLVVMLVSLIFSGACRGDQAPLEPNRVPAAADIVSEAAQGHIAFVTDRDGNYEIYRMAPDGAGQTNLTNDPRPDFQPAWSPDGSKIAFSRIDFDGSQNLWLMNADGTGQTKISSVDGGEPAFSPDGTRLSYTSFSPAFNAFDIRLVNSDGTGDVALTSGGSWNFLSSWSPDGTMILFTSTREKDRTSLAHLSSYVISPDGSGLSRVGTFSGAEFIARWMPDSRHIVFSRNNQGIWITDLDGSEAHELHHALPYESLGGVSPDGEWIVFDAGKRSLKGAVNVFVMRADGSDVVQLTTLGLFNGTSTWGR